jgi:hypothetical protein
MIGTESIQDKQVLSQLVKVLELEEAVSICQQLVA